MPNVEHLPRTVLVWIAGIGMAVIGFIAVFSWSATASTATAVTQHEVKIQTLEKQYDRIEAQLYRISERLGVPKVHV